MISEPIVIAQYAKCPHCPAWVITHGAHCRKIREQTLLLSCRVQTCSQEFEVDYGSTKMFNVPASWVDRGYFYIGELDHL